MDEIDDHDHRQSMTYKLLLRKFTKRDPKLPFVPHDYHRIDVNLKFNCALSYYRWTDGSESGGERLSLGHEFPPPIDIVVQVHSYMCPVDIKQAMHDKLNRLDVELPRRKKLITFAWKILRGIIFDAAKPTPYVNGVLDLCFGVDIRHHRVYNTSVDHRGSDVDVGDETVMLIERSFQESQPRMVPTAESTIRSLKKRKVVDGVESTNNCCICLEDLSCGDDDDKELGLISMPCSHVFHDDCIVKWLRTSHYCPVCRFQMPASKSRRRLIET